MLGTAKLIQKDIIFLNFASNHSTIQRPLLNRHDSLMKYYTYFNSQNLAYNFGHFRYLKLVGNGME